MTIDPVPILVDTDVGDDVDDAFALALAALHPRLRLVGVTTVDGPVADRARLARVLLDACGHSAVPIGAGASHRSDGRTGIGRFSHAPLLRGVSPFTGPSAAAVIRDCAARERLTLVALGPLTNIAAAITAEPAIAQRARLVMMGGAPSVPYPDWNLRCDPAAARVVLRSGMAVTMVGINVTMRCQMTSAQIRRLFTSRTAHGVLLARCVLAWRTWHRRMPILHDMLAVAVAADAALTTTAIRRVTILPGGFSAAVKGLPPNARVCTAIDHRRFDALLDTLIIA